MVAWVSSGSLETDRVGSSQSMWTAWGSAGGAAAPCGYRCRTLNYSINKFNLVRNSEATEQGDFGLGSFLWLQLGCWQGLQLSEVLTGAGGSTFEMAHSHGCGKRPQFLTG